jgi:hypothetical protein
MVGAATRGASTTLGASATRDWQPVNTVKPVSMRVVAKRFIVLFSAFDESPWCIVKMKRNRGYSLSFGRSGVFFK